MANANIKIESLDEAIAAIYDLTEQIKALREELAAEKTQTEVHYHFSPSPNAPHTWTWPNYQPIVTY